MNARTRRFRPSRGPKPRTQLGIWPRLGLAAALATLVLALAGCVAIPASGVGVSMGPVSDQWSVEFDPTLGTPRRMTNGSLDDPVPKEGEDPKSSEAYGRAMGPALGAAEAEAAVRNVLREQATLFRIRFGQDDFALANSYARSWLRVVVLRQLYRGIPVAGAGYEAHVLPNGRVGTIEGRFHPDIDINVTPALGSSQAEAQARSAVLGISPANLPSFQFERDAPYRDAQVLAIVPLGASYLLAWGVVIEVAPREAYRVWVDASDGRVLGRERVYGEWAR